MASARLGEGGEAEALEAAARLPGGHHECTSKQAGIGHEFVA